MITNSSGSRMWLGEDGRRLRVLVQGPAIDKKTQHQGHEEQPHQDLASLETEGGPGCEADTEVFSERSLVTCNLVSPKHR